MKKPPVSWNSMDRKKAPDVITRFVAVQVESVPHELIESTQKASPSVSGNRLRKSRYCWRTKNSVPSIGFEVGAERSSSMIVTVALELLPSETPVPVTLDKVTVNVWSPSTKTSLTMGT